MTVWAIADLHLSFGVKDKGMDIFGEHWSGWTDKIKEQWSRHITDNDLVLIAGDISWGMRLEEAKADLDWIGSLPGTKVLIRGNHDYWWNSLTQVQKILPPSCHPIQNTSFMWNDIAVAGTRLWDVPGLNFSSFHLTYDKLNTSTTKEAEEESKKIYKRELLRLETSLKSIPQNAKKKIVMTHYPPIGAYLEETEVSLLLEKYQVDICVFGHLHNLNKKLPLFGTKNHIAYHLTACDYLLDFCPLKIL